MLSPASGPAVLRQGNEMVNLYLVSLEIKPQWSGLLTCIASDLVKHAKILLYCTEYRRPTTLAPTNEELWAQWGKNLIGKNNLSIELSEVNVWLVWILTTKRKSLMRVETCQKKCFTFWLFAVLTCSSDLNFQTVFTLWIYMYPFNLFYIEPLIVHLYLNDVVLI
jgi:hypothetical protein